MKRYHFYFVGKKLKLIFVCYFAFELLYLLYLKYFMISLKKCYYNEFNAGDSHQMEDVLISKYLPPLGGSIFFHETTCSNYFLTKINARQACAIESAALHNPHTSIFVLFVTPADTNGRFMNEIRAYKNVHLRRLNLWTYAYGTPIYDWLTTEVLFESCSLVSHISDFLRYISLWRWGGTHMDLDTISLRSIEDLPPNYTGAQWYTQLAAGVMNFAPTGFGHHVAEQCLIDFARNFKGCEWANNGPGVIMRVLQNLCETNDVAVILNRTQCHGFHVFMPHTFYAIPWPEWRLYFNATRLAEVLLRSKDSYISHVWNKLSKLETIKLRYNITAYEYLAKNNCPKVYSAAGDEF